MANGYEYAHGRTRIIGDAGQTSQKCFAFVFGGKRVYFLELINEQERSFAAPAGPSAISRVQPAPFFQRCGAIAPTSMRRAALIRAASAG